MKLTITGNTLYKDEAEFARILSEIPVPITLLITGGQKGVEGLTRAYARKHCIPVLVHHGNTLVMGPNWFQKRNLVMFNDGDNILLIGEPGSYTLRQMAKLGKHMGKPTKVYEIEDGGLVPISINSVLTPIGTPSAQLRKIASRYGEDV